MSNVTLHPGDNRETLRRLIAQGVRVHSVVTDPPYGLVSVQKRFAKEGSAPAKTSGNDGSFGRLSAGFMGKAWDGSGIERDPEFWKLIHDILLPGGYVFAFSGSRTGHWQACAMEMAGFDMHPMHGWCFATGFPKAHAADKAIDQYLGCEGGRIAKGAAVKRMIPGAEQCATGSWERKGDREYQPTEYIPTSDEAKQWQGWAYGKQTQKPSLEPIFLAQKPFSEKNGGANLIKHGVGAVNITDCRGAPDVANPIGRHPSNLLLDGSNEIAAMLPESKHNFFHRFTPDADPLFYHAKAGKLDRAGSKHPTVKPIALMQYLIRHITPPGGTVLDPFAGSGTTGVAAQNEGFDCILMEAEAEYLTFLNQRFGLTNDDDPLGATTENNVDEFEGLL